VTQLILQSCAVYIKCRLLPSVLSADGPQYTRLTQRIVPVTCITWCMRHQHSAHVSYVIKL